MQCARVCQNTEYTCRMWRGMLCRTSDTIPHTFVIILTVEASLAYSSYNSDIAYARGSVQRRNLCMLPLPWANNNASLVDVGCIQYMLCKYRMSTSTSPPNMHILFYFAFPNFSSLLLVKNEIDQLMMWWTTCRPDVHHSVCDLSKYSQRCGVIILQAYILRAKQCSLYRCHIPRDTKQSLQSNLNLYF